MLSRQDHALIRKAGNTFLRKFTEKVHGLPHRDVTILTYRDWFEAYINGLRQFHEEVSAAASASASSSASSPTESRARWLRAAVPTLTSVRHELDALLLSSIFAKTWTEVYTPKLPALPLGEEAMRKTKQADGVSEREKRADSSDQGEHARAGCADSGRAESAPTTWWHVPSSPARGLWWSTLARIPDASTSHTNTVSTDTHQLVYPTLELCSPEFMTEPLLGGEALSVYLDMVKRLRRMAADGEDLREWGAERDRQRRSTRRTSPLPAATTTRTTDEKTTTTGTMEVAERGEKASKKSVEDDQDGLPSLVVSRDSASYRLFLPYTTVWTLKAESFGRTGSSSPPEPSRGLSRSTALSFQERQIRQSVLQSLQFSLQLTHMLLREKPHAPVAPLLYLMTPTEEFDAICQLPRLRPHLTPQYTGPHAHAAPPVPHSMEEVCDLTTSRLSYLGQALALLCPRRPNAGIKDEKSTKEEEGEDSGASAPTPALVLAPPHLHSVYRSCRAPLLRTRASSVQEMRELVDHLNMLGTLEASGDGNPRGSQRRVGVHAQAVKGCKEVVRRLSQREENMRQALSLK